MANSFNREQLLHVTLLLTLLANICTVIGTVTSQWFTFTINNEENSIGTFCRHSGNANWECLSTSTDILCIISIVLLLATNILGVLLIKPTVKKEIARISLIVMLFAASILLLAIIPARNETYGFSFHFIMTACALAQLNVLISGFQLGRMFRKESSKVNNICTNTTLLLLARGLTALIAIFTVVGMSTPHWIGKNTIRGWSGAGTFCRQFNITTESCLIPTSTTILSVTAAVISVVAVVLVICGILNAIRRRAESYALSIFLLPTSIILWFTIATTMRLENTGYSFRVLIASGPFANVALLISGIWFSISEEPSNVVKQRF